jgi:hypothetical protein
MSDCELSNNLRFRRLGLSCGLGGGEDTGLARHGCTGMAMQRSLDSSSRLSGTQELGLPTRQPG